MSAIARLGATRTGAPATPPEPVSGDRPASEPPASFIRARSDRANVAASPAKPKPRRAAEIAWCGGIPVVVAASDDDEDGGDDGTR